ncbi:MAG TPA: group III truncated hemoglobin [Stellaceae bacterium]|nr:group III truncated hemoglobin [Stellaceae bacterium]
MTSAYPVSETEIAQLVDRFYAKARRDPLIGPLFEDAVEDWDAHLETLRRFWSSVMLTSGRYKGNPVAAHMRHPIRPEFFDRWLTLFGETAEEVVGGDGAALFRSKANRIAESLKLALFFRPDNIQPRSLQPQGPDRRHGRPAGGTDAPP